MKIIVTHIDTACCLIEIGGFKILTDPTLDNSGKYYHHGFGAISKKTESPILDQISLNEIDLILLSHPQHKDNFDTKGRALARSVPLILSTKKIERAYSNGKGLQPWDNYEIKIPNGGTLKITATPAQHHPSWLPKFLSGEVIGFIIQHSEIDETIYISGDTVFFEGIKEIAKRFPNINYALIHVGSAEFRYLTGLGKFTMDAKGFIDTINTIIPELAIPIHNGGWTHFKENDQGILAELSKATGAQNERVHFLKRGEPTELKFLKTSSKKS
jgi:L-ascorbate metabolism protein UlaG (beta-lactamase superfamily)